MKAIRFAVRSLVAVCLAFFMSSASCELFENADNITFTADLEHPFAITEAAVDRDGGPFSTDPKDEVLDAAKVNTEFAKYADKIESITINSVSYVLSGYASTDCPTVGFSNGTFTFSDPDGTAAGVVVEGVSHPDLNAAQGPVHTLDITQEEADELANLLKNKKKVRIDASGTLSCTPLFLNVDVTLNCTLTAKVL